MVCCDGCFCVFDVVLFVLYVFGGEEVVGVDGDFLFGGYVCGC